MAIVHVDDRPNGLDFRAQVDSYWTSWYKQVGIVEGGTNTMTAPAPTATLGGGTPNTADCQKEVDGLISNLNANYGETLDLDRDQSKMADFVRGPNNPGNFDWWRLTSFGNTFLVFGKDAGRRGFSDNVGPIKRSQLIDFINQKKLFCRVILMCFILDPSLTSNRLHQC
jgi:hypothetical protein